IMAAYRASMTQQHIDFLPGSVELGDFDATSTTVGVAPVGELASLPDTALANTFDKYWSNSAERRKPGSVWDAYTPYELRTGGNLRGTRGITPGGIAFRSRVDGQIASARVGGNVVSPSPSGEVMVRQLPATINLTFKARE